MKPEEYNRKVFDTLPNTITEKHFFKAGRHGLVMTITRIAAAIMVPALIAGGYLAGKHSAGAPPQEQASIEPAAVLSDAVYSVNDGVRGKVALPDGSVVWLNCGSSVTVPAGFNGQNRSVSLDGEGYFNIVSDSEHPFYIHTAKDITVKVTGTEFNVRCYSGSHDFDLTLVRGSVELLRNNCPDVEVKPGEEVIIRDMTTEPALSKADIAANAAWVAGRLVFDNTPMRDVIERLEHWYGVRIKVTDTDIYKSSLTADFESEPIGRVLELMEVTSGIRSRVNSNEITLYR